MREARLRPDRWRRARLSTRILRGGSAALGWTIREWFHNGKPTALGAISGAVAGLVAITPAAGFVQPFPALLIGLIAGLFCSFMVVKVKSWFGYDDSLDAFGVHGAGGTIGALLTGLFANDAINPVFGADVRDNVPTGLFEGNLGSVGESAGRCCDCLGPCRLWERWCCCSWSTRRLDCVYARMLSARDWICRNTAKKDTTGNALDENRDWSD